MGVIGGEGKSEEIGRRGSWRGEGGRGGGGERGWIFVDP